MWRPASSVPPRMPLTCTWVPNRTTCAGSARSSQAWSKVGSGAAGVGVGEGLGAGVPDRQPLVGVDELVMGRPPDLVVGRGGDGAEFGAGDRTPDGGVEVRGAAFLGFDGAEVLHVPADAAAGVLPEPVHQRGEVDRVSGGPPVVIALRVHRRALAVHPAVGVQGQGEKGRGPVAPGEHPPYRAFVDGSPGQIRGVLAAPGGSLDRLGWWIEWGEPTAYPCRAEFGVEFGDRLGDLLTRDLVADGLAFGVGGEEIGPGGHQRLVVLTGRGPVGDRLRVEVPALAALDHPQPAGLLRTGRALVGPGGPAGHGHDVDAAGGGVDAAHGQWPDADAVLFGQGLGDISAQRQYGPLRPGHPRGINVVVWSSGRHLPRVLTCRSAERDGVVASGARSAPSAGEGIAP